MLWAAEDAFGWGRFHQRLSMHPIGIASRSQEWYGLEGLTRLQNDQMCLCIYIIIQPYIYIYITLYCNKHCRVSCHIFIVRVGEANRKLCCFVCLCGCVSTHGMVAQVQLRRNHPHPIFPFPFWPRGLSVSMARSKWCRNESKKWV